MILSNKNKGKIPIKCGFNSTNQIVLPALNLFAQHGAKLDKSVKKRPFVAAGRIITAKPNLIGFAPAG